MASSADKGKGEVWVLDTETKGTGANMVPLERRLRKGGERVPGFTLPERREPAPPPLRKPHRFRILNIMTREVLADDVDARHAVAALEDVRSIVDVSIYAWNEAAEEWVRLSFGEAKQLWDLRYQIPINRPDGQDSNRSITQNTPNG